MHVAPRGCSGERQRELLRARLDVQEDLLGAGEGRARGRSRSLRPPSGPGSSRPRRRLTGAGDDGDAIAEEMRACSQREYELQAEMKSASDAFTEAEVEAAHLRDRRGEAART